MHYHRLTEFAVGLIFGIGLILSGMTDPSKVIGFLDLAGSWDPSLAFVMGGAILVGVFAFAFAKKRTTSFLGGALHLPKSTAIGQTPCDRWPGIRRWLGSGRLLPWPSLGVAWRWTAQGRCLCAGYAGGHAGV